MIKRSDLLKAFEKEQIRQKKAVGETEVRSVSPEDLILHKIIAGCPRDVEDVKNVLLKNPEVDQAYIRHWLDDFAVALSEPLLDRFEEAWKASQ